MSHFTVSENIIDIFSDLRICMDRDGGNMLLEKSELFNKKFPDTNSPDLSRLISQIDLHSLCREILNQKRSPEPLSKTYRLYHQDKNWIIHVKAKNIESNGFVLEADLFAEEDIENINIGVLEQWKGMDWIPELLGQLREPIVILDARSGNILYINSSALNLVNMKEKEVLGEHYSVMYENDFEQSFKKERHQLFNEGQTVYNNIRLKNHASKSQDARVRAELVSIGNLKYVLTVIYESRISEDPVKESEYLHFKALFDDSLLGSALVDLNGNIFNINNSFTAFTGHSKSDIEKLNFKDLAYELFDKGTADKLFNSFQHASKIANEEVLLLTKGGDWRWCRLSSSIIHDQQGKSLFFLIMLENIHDAKLTEIKYQLNRELLSALSANLNECIYRSSIDEGIIFTNDAFVKKFGYNSFKEIEKINPEIFYANEKYRKEVLEEIEKDGKIIAKEIYFKRKDGSRFWGLLNCSLYIDEKGKKYLDGVITDISNQKDTEKLLKENNKELKKINNEMDRFVYSVTHDLRAPLMSLLGLIKISVNENQQDELSEYLEMMQKSVYKLDGFIKDIIDFSRNSRSELNKSLIDVEKLIEDTWSNLEFISEIGKIDFQFENRLDREFYSDEKRLSIILTNLLSNAIKYHNYNQVKPLIKVRIEREDECVKILVKDNGPGIPEEYQDKIFDMFFRANDSKNGSGLGLYIVKEAVEKLGGVIKLKSSPILGSNFLVYIPL